MTVRFIKELDTFFATETLPDGSVKYAFGFTEEVAVARLQDYGRTANVLFMSIDDIATELLKSNKLSDETRLVFMDHLAAVTIARHGAS